MNPQAMEASALITSDRKEIGKQTSLQELKKEGTRKTQRNPLLFENASGSDVIRAHQKDEQFKREFEEKLTDICNSWIGQRHTLRYSKELQLLSNLTYFSVSSLRGVQTLGEEFCDIRKIDTNNNTELSTSKRFSLMWWSELFPFFYNKALAKLNIITRPSYSGIPLSESPLRTKFNSIVQRLIPLLKDTSVFMNRIHLGIFYFGGYYYEWSKRFTGVKYIFDRPSGMYRPHYHILGLLIFIQLLISTYQFCKSIISSYNRVEPNHEWIEEDYHPNQNSSNEIQPNCVLCLEPRKYPTVAECGHIFCWNCIHDSCQNKPECPLCRRQILPQNLTRIYHYSP